MRKLVCFHLLNDYSGSPKVLKTTLEILLNRGIIINLITSQGGVLDELKAKENIRFSYFSYNFSENQFVMLLKFAVVQFYLFFFSFRYIFRKHTVFYINTILPIGAALAGRMIGKKVVYHYHENAFVKSAFYRVLCRMMQYLANEIICVSEYQRSFLARQHRVTVIPNSLPKIFCNAFDFEPKQAFKHQNVLMLSSLKLNKGILEFIKIAKQLPQYNFELVINDTQDNIHSFLADYHIEKSTNLIIFERQNDVIPFYKRATIVVNLSDKKQIIETFGLTALEAMTAGLPIIVPTIGGIAEMVEDGINGYKIDIQELDLIVKHIENILSDYELYEFLASNALKTAKNYDNSIMMNRILKIITR